LSVRNGDFVHAGQTMAVVSQNRDLFVKAEVQPKYYAMLSEIASATFRNPATGAAYSLEELGGQLVSYGKSVDLQHPLIPVLFRINNTKDWIPGSFVELYIRTQGGQSVITVPRKAILEEMGNHFVYVQLTPEYFEKRQVNIGKTDGVRTEILSGLNGSERVVVDGAVLVKVTQSAGGLDAESGHQH
jgi:multidrug efflux pump subunit AcrA (membrane-fusion protein)